MPDSADVLVLGAGVVGSSIAYELAKDGRDVIVLDRSSGPGLGSTSASSAVVRFNYSDRTGVALAWESWRQWQEWREYIGPIEGAYAQFHRIGGLTVDSPDQDLAKTCALFDEVGVPYEWWEAEDILTGIPGIDIGDYYPPRQIADPAFWDDTDATIAGLWTPDAGYVDDPQLAARNLMQAALREGARFAPRAEVTRIALGEGEHILACAGGRVFTARTVINAAGPHSAIINKMAGVDDDFAVRTRPMRQEVHELRAPEGYGPDRVMPLIADPGLGVYLRGTPTGGVIIGGLEPPCDPFEWLDEPDTASLRTTQQRFDEQTLRAARRFPALRIENHPRGVAGVYDVADDWTPIYDRTGVKGYYVAIGTSGNQFKNAPTIGRIMRTVIEAAEEGRSGSEPAHLVLAKTGIEIDLGRFSRMRTVDPSATALGVLG